MKTYFFTVMFVALAGLTSSHAQERTAGGPTETQMTWSSLTNLVNAANTKAEGVNARIDQMIKCNRKAMAYAPGAGADGDGCIENSKIVALNTKVAEINTKIATMNTQITTLNNQMNDVYGNITRINTTLNAHGSQITQLFGQTGDLYNRTTDLYNRSADLYNKVADLYNHINRIGVDLNTKGAQIGDLYARVADINVKIVDINKRITAINDDIKDLYNITDDLTANINSIRTCGKQNKIWNPNVGCVTVVNPTPAADPRWSSSGPGPSASPPQGSGNRSYIENALRNISVPECSGMSVGAKCAPDGAKCAIVARADRSCGSHGDYQCTTYTTTIYKCD